MERARKVMPGGVNSPVRSFRAVGGTPPFFERAEGAWLTDLDGNRYLDCVLAYGPLILGHSHPAVRDAIREQLELGDVFGGPTLAEAELAEEICASLPGMEMVRLVNSGTEAAMSAVRLARAATGRDIILKFAGCYHGHSDALLAAAGSGIATLTIPGSPGVPAGTVADTLVVDYNDLEAVQRAFEVHQGEIAAVIVEPVAGNMGVVPPEPSFLGGLRGLTTAEGSLLIFDEVITGFRLGRAGAQGRYQVRPDLTCLGKVIGGGMPIGAFGGGRALMAQLAPEGPVYQAGTLSGNPLAVAAGRATLRQLAAGEPYQRLEEMGRQLEIGIRDAGEANSVPLQVQRVGSMLTVFFSQERVTDYPEAQRADGHRFARLHRRLLEQGVFWPPSQFESAFLSLAHEEAELEFLVRAFERGLRGLGP